MAYTFSTAVEIQNGKVGADHADFPILVSGTFDGTAGEADLRTVGNGGNIQNTVATGGSPGNLTVPADLVFSPNDNGSSKYSFEFERYDATTGFIYAWVKIPVMDADTDLVFYMVYGDSVVTTSQEDINGTWNAGYKVVWHMNGDTLLTTHDSTSNGHDDGGGLGCTFRQTGRNGGYCVDFDGDNDYMEIDDHDDFTMTDFTLEGVVDADVVSALSVIMQQYDGTSLDGFILMQSSSLWYFYVFQNPDNSFADSDSAPSGTWEYLAGARNNGVGTHYLFVDGLVQVTTGSIGGEINSSDKIYVGIRSGGDRDFDGRIEELRISDVFRNADWVLTTENSYDSSTFLIFGTEGTPGAEEGVGVESMFMGMNF